MPAILVVKCAFCLIAWHSSCMRRFCDKTGLRNLPDVAGRWSVPDKVPLVFANLMLPCGLCAMCRAWIKGFDKLAKECSQEVAS